MNTTVSQQPLTRESFSHVTVILLLHKHASLLAFVRALQ